MSYINRIGFALCFFGLLFTAAHALDDGRLKEIQDGFTVRSEIGFSALKLEEFKVPHLDPPLAPNHPPYTAGYSYAITTFALGSLWRDQHLPEANRLLREMCDFYSANRDIRNDDANFYWWTDMVVRMIEFYGHNGSRVAHRLNEETEDAALKMMWLWAKERSRIADTELHSDYWYIRGSENHHLQGVAACWDFARLFSRDVRYSGLIYDDGHTAADHYSAWTSYLKNYLQERAKRGLFVEIASAYNFSTLKSIYEFFDFSEDPVLKQRAGYLISFYWASWAQEQLDGVRGGGKTRTYPNRWSSRGEDAFRRMAWFYFGIGTAVRPDGPNELIMLSSAYRLPLVVIDLAIDPAGRGIYEIRQWPLGLAVPGYYDPYKGYRLKIDEGGIYRYSYCTPDFILGTLMTPALPLEGWSMISSQNRWQGVIFAGATDARIYPQPQPTHGVRTYNAFVSVQSKGALITQKLAANRDAGEMRIWFSAATLKGRKENAGWVFARAPRAYAAIRVVRGGRHWQNVAPDDLSKGEGEWLVCDDSFTPVIFEVARQSDFADGSSFENQVLSRPLKATDTELTYTSLAGDRLTFYPGQAVAPRINGSEVSYAPEAAFQSPFLTADWDKGVITIQKDSRRLVLDFHDPLTR